MDSLRLPAGFDESVDVTVIRIGQLALTIALNYSEKCFICTYIQTCRKAYLRYTYDTRYYIYSETIMRVEWQRGRVEGVGA